jgi:hypothetical protein
VADSHHPFNLEFSQDVSSKGYLGSLHGLKVTQAASNTIELVTDFDI